MTQPFPFHDKNHFFNNNTASCPRTNSKIYFYFNHDLNRNILFSQKLSCPLILFKKKKLNIQNYSKLISAKKKFIS